MPWSKLDNGNKLDAYQYEEDIEVLWVRFKSGRCHSYVRVKREMVDTLIAAAEPETILNSIVQGLYPCLTPQQL